MSSENPSGPVPRRESLTIVDALLAQAASRGGRPAFTVVGLGGERQTLTYGELLVRGLRVAAGLRERGLRQGDRLLVCLPTSLELLTTLYGTLLAGGVCVPVYPPQVRHGLRPWKDQVAAISRLTQPCGAVVGPSARLHLASLLEQVGGDLFATTPSQLETIGTDAPGEVMPADLAFVQFTSGTTRRPRGVSVSHRALLANMSALLEVMPLTAADVSVSWLPPYHDMGLVGHIFVPVLAGVHQLLMPPAIMRRHPGRWLELCASSRATQTTAPNFAYALCAERLGRNERQRLDLGSLRWVLNGAEMVLPETLEAFSRAFAVSGFRGEAFHPVYGLAEATLTATFSRDERPRIDRVDRGRLSRCGEAVPAAVGVGTASAQALVAVGQALPGHELRVRKAEAPCGPRQVGEIWLRGPSVMSGYFNDPSATREVLRDGWLRTGDLGYLDEEGRLHLTGRRKDLIIKDGCNLLPDDVEAALNGLAGLRPGRAVAFGLPSRAAGTEELVIVAEPEPDSLGSDTALRQQVARAVAERTGVRPDRVELAAPGALPKTTSGKLQRSKVKELYQTGQPLSTPSGEPVDGVIASMRSAVDLARSRIGRLLGWR